MKNKEIKIFVGYEFSSRSKSYERTELESMIENAVDSVKTDIHNVDLVLDCNDSKYGEPLLKEIIEKIKNCDIAIFEISDNNPNVMFELGIAYGIGKYIIILKNRKTIRKNPIPSDLRGIYRGEYEGPIANIRGRLANSIKMYLLDILGERERAKEKYKSLSVIRDFWGFIEGVDKEIFVVCPVIPLEDRTQYSLPESEEYMFLEKFGDKDSLIEITALLNKLYPTMTVKKYTCEDMPKEGYESNLILIGGPGYNTIVKEILERINSPFNYDLEEDLLVDKFKNIKYGSKFSSGNIVKDYGFFLKIPNPYNDTKKLIMINGIHTYGVFGVVKAFTTTDQGFKNCEQIIEKFGKDPSFCVLFEIEILNNQVITPKININNIISYPWEENND